MDLEGDYDRRLLVRVDATGYGASDDVRQGEIQTMLGQVLEGAAGVAGFDRSRWHTQPAGDGELAVLPSDVRERSVVDRYPRALAEALTEANGRVPANERLRVRLAVHYGMVSVGRLGFPGQGAVEVSRMVDGRTVRLAMRRSLASLVVVFSETIFRDSIEQNHTRLRPEELREVEIKNKEFHRRAWLYLPGHDVHAVDLEPAAEPEPAERAPRRPAAPNDGPRPGTHIENTFQAPVHAQRIVFGVSYGSEM